MTDEKKKRYKELLGEIRAKSLFESTYERVTYGGEKRMYNILNQLNIAIDACFELSSLYDCSELQNQHTSIAMDDFEDIALKLQEMRETLFGDSFNYKRVAELLENQVDEIDKLEQEFEKLHQEMVEENR